MTNEIIELLPSIDLKAKIRETDYKFTESELLQIIGEYTPTLEERLSLYKRFSEISAPDVSALAKAYIKYEEEGFKRFVEAPEGFVYELHVKDTPDACDEKYLCDSYHAAFVCIDRFFEEYGSDYTKENDKTRYRIVKRKIFSEGDVFDEDEYAEMVLGPRKTVLKVSDYRDPADCQLEFMCSECKEICPRKYTELFFPCFAHDRAIIKHNDYAGKECYGVNLCLGNTCDGKASEFFVIPLDSSTIREHRFDDAFNTHEHIELPLATLATPDDLDETMRKNYFAFLAFLDTHQPRM